MWQNKGPTVGLALGILVDKVRLLRGEATIIHQTLSVEEKRQRLAEKLDALFETEDVEPE